ncbi:MAG: sulfate transporter family protein [Pseudomonadota bacterium]|nr:sulfate transporter family protein [Pseudomonadota bacterium]
MLQDALDSLNDVFSPPFRGVMVKSVALTLGVLALAGFGLDRAALHFVTTSHGWLAAAISVLIGLGVLAGLVLLAAPTTSLVASFFLDDIAAIVEREIDPAGPPGRPAPLLDSTLAALRFAALTLAVMLAALALLFVPGVGFAAWFAANAYLLGREYFELAAMRFRPAADARAMRRYFALPVFLNGLIVAAFVSVPILNLATPLFATALMARLHKRLERQAFAAV